MGVDVYVSVSTKTITIKSTRHQQKRPPSHHITMEKDRYEAPYPNPYEVRIHSIVSYHLSTCRHRRLSKPRSMHPRCHPYSGLEILRSKSQLVQYQKAHFLTKLQAAIKNSKTFQPCSGTHSSPLRCKVPALYHFLSDKERSLLLASKPLVNLLFVSRR